MINFETIKQVAWLSDEFVQKPIRGVLFTFHGLNSVGEHGAPSDEEIALAKEGFLVVSPYYGPWSWMNRLARKFIDELIASVYAAFQLPEDVPLVLNGGSMGGFSALLYARYAKVKVARCVAVCPVCDLGYHFTERPDVPRTIRHAFYGYAESFEEVIKEHSPVYQVENMPQIPYFIVDIIGDPAVNRGQAL